MHVQGRSQEGGGGGGGGGAGGCDIKLAEERGGRIITRFTCVRASVLDSCPFALIHKKGLVRNITYNK